MTDKTDTTKYWRYALLLALFTITYDLAEGLVSVYFGSRGGTLTLLGFGIDSLVEVISGTGILVMVMRIRQNPESDQSRFERAALRVTGWAFYLFSGGMGVTAAYNLITAHKTETALPGLVISVISAAVMWILVAGKKHVGRALNSAPIITDANCSLVCVYMSLVLLGASFVYRFTGFALVDTLGVIGLIYFSIDEGKEAFEESRGIEELEAE